MTTSPRRRNRKVLAPLATLLAAGAIIVGSGASFTSSSASTGNVYATGTLSQSNSKANEAIFDAANLKPGDVLRGSVVIENTGSLPAVFSLSEDATNGFTDPSALSLQVSHGTTDVYAGTFGELGAALVLGEFAPGEARTYTFAVTLSADAGNAEQGKQASATYAWDSIQTAGQTIAQP